MRKNSPRKWLHACLDLLPVILIPVFMIYSHRHTIDSGSIEVPQNEVVDFNQLSNIVDYDFSFDNNLTIDITNNYAQATLITYAGTGSVIYNFVNVVTGLDEEHKYLIELRDLQYVNEGFTIRLGAPSYMLLFDFYTQTYTPRILENVNEITLGFDARYSSENDFPKDISFYIQVFDLTQMFGSGNEPTIQQFNQWYDEPYYDYTLSHKELLKNTSTITYSDTDIMSQFTYQLYNSVDKYFNMGNVFNMTSVYDWFNLNIFGGNAPISIYIVWNIVLYEFVMDLLFLLYGLFMWFIDMVEHIMDKPFKSIK